MQKLSHSIWKWKVLSLLVWEEMAALSIPLFDYRELVALMKLVLCQHCLFIIIYIVFSKKHWYARGAILVVAFGSQSIKTSNVILYIVFLCISQLPTPRDACTRKGQGARFIQRAPKIQLRRRIIYQPLTWRGHGDDVFSKWKILHGFAPPPENNH